MMEFVLCSLLAVGTDFCTSHAEKGQSVAIIYPVIYIKNLAWWYSRPKPEELVRFGECTDSPESG